VRRWTLDVKATEKAVFLRSSQMAFDSVVTGSRITGAPGQPVGQYGPGYHPGRVGGFLRASWQFVVEAARALIMTKTVYAPAIEDGTREGRQLTLRSTVGGFHSVKLTVQGWQRIVEAAIAEVRGA